MKYKVNRFAGVSRRLRPGTGRFTMFICIFLSVLSMTGCGVKPKQSSSSGSDQNTAGTQQSGIESDTLQAVFFDVGKGDCILLSMDGSHVLIDAGYEETSKDITDELRERGIDSLDAMIITHYDKDHVGGAAEIAQSVPVDTFYLPDYTGDEDKSGDLLAMIEQKDLKNVRVSKEVQLSLGEAEIEIDPALIEYDPQQKNDNDASLIVKIFYNDDEWLFSGDIEKDAIDVWLDSNTQTFDIMKMPHHGRKEGGTKKMIKNVDPVIAVITDSIEDPADDKVLDQLEDKDVIVYRSAVNGTITILGDGSGKFKVNTEK